MIIATRRDAALMPEVAHVFEENFHVYGVRKVWRQLKREGHDTARCTVARLMRGMGLQGVIRGKPVRTTISDKAAPCPLDHVNRQFKAPRPNALWVSDFTYVATWSGFAYVAFIIDAYARRIVGWTMIRSHSSPPRRGSASRIIRVGLSGPRSGGSTQAAEPPDTAAAREAPGVRFGRSPSASRCRRNTVRWRASFGMAPPTRPRVAGEQHAYCLLAEISRGRTGPAHAGRAASCGRWSRSGLPPPLPPSAARLWI
jgi:hypothetical protein